MTTSILYLWRASSGRCYYCGTTPHTLQMGVDHLLPRSRGGRTISGNVVPCCNHCNSVKNAKTFHEYRTWSLQRWLLAEQGRKQEDFSFWGELHTTLPLNFNPEPSETNLDEDLAGINLSLLGNDILGFTGHRPEKIPGWENPYNQEVIRYLLHTFILKGKYVAAISGMALGFDTIAAIATLNSGAQLIAAIPFPQQPAYWKLHEMQRWKDIRDKASVVKNCSLVQAPDSYQVRNEWIVDHSKRIITLWNGEKKGGTWNTIHYANMRGVPVMNIWNSYMKFRRP